MGHPTNGPQATRKQAAFHFWNKLKAVAQEIVDHCFRIPGYAYGGTVDRDGSAMGFTQQSLRASRVFVTVISAGFIGWRVPEVNIYHI